MKTPPIERDFIKSARPLPTDEPARNQLTPVSVRMTAAEKAHLRAAAGSRSLSQHIRSVLFDQHLSHRQRGRTPREDRAQLAKLLAQLGRSDLSVSLRSLARAAELGALPVTEDVTIALKSACDDIRAMRRALITALGIKAEE